MVDHRVKVFIPFFKTRLPLQAGGSTLKHLAGSKYMYSSVQVVLSCSGVKCHVPLSTASRTIVQSMSPFQWCLQHLPVLWHQKGMVVRPLSFDKPALFELLLQRPESSSSVFSFPSLLPFRFGDQQNEDKLIASLPIKQRCVSLSGSLFEKWTRPPVTPFTEVNEADCILQVKTKATEFGVGRLKRFHATSKCFFLLASLICEHWAPLIAGTSRLTKNVMLQVCTSRTEGVIRTSHGSPK